MSKHLTLTLATVAALGVSLTLTSTADAFGSHGSNGSHGGFFSRHNGSHGSFGGSFGGRRHRGSYGSNGSYGGNGSHGGSSSNCNCNCGNSQEVVQENQEMNDNRANVPDRDEHVMTTSSGDVRRADYRDANEANVTINAPANENTNAPPAASDNNPAENEADRNKDAEKQVEKAADAVPAPEQPKQ